MKHTRDTPRRVHTVSLLDAVVMAGPVNEVVGGFARDDHGVIRMVELAADDPRRGRKP